MKVNTFCEKNDNFFKSEKDEGRETPGFMRFARLFRAYNYSKSGVGSDANSGRNQRRRDAKRLNHLEFGHDFAVFCPVLPFARAAARAEFVLQYKAEPARAGFA